MPTAEKMNLEFIPLIIRAAGLVVDGDNKEKVVTELSTMDSLVDQYVRRSKRQFVLSVNSKIRHAIMGDMTGGDISLYIG
jgi:hypothetical protein